MKTADTKKMIFAIGAQLLLLAISLLVIYAIVRVASKGWKKGQESSYCIDGNPNCYNYNN